MHGVAVLDAALRFAPFHHKPKASRPSYPARTHITGDMVCSPSLHNLATLILTPTIAIAIMKLEIEWDAVSTTSPLLRHTKLTPAQSDASHRRRYDRKASTIHGWVTKMRGTLFDNEAVRRRGIREMKAAKAVRAYKRQRAAERRARGQSGGGFFSSLFGGRRRSSSRRHGSTSTRTRTVLARESSHRSQTQTHRRKDSQPFLHFSHRTKPHHHGHGTRIVGHITQRRELVEKGAAMNEAARQERERERRRRQKQRERDSRYGKREASRGSRR